MSTKKITLRANFADSRITRALREGRVTSDIVDLDICGPESAYEGFKPMVRDGAFEVGELALATFLQARTYNKPLAMIPAVLSGRFQHDCIGYNINSGDMTPKDIEGRRVAVRAYTQTTGLWVRGILAHEYGVDLDKVTWCCTEGAHLAEFNDPPNVERLPAGSKIGQMLVDGQVDAVILGAAAMPKSPLVRPLIPDAKAAAQAWYARNQHVPINHIVAIKSSLMTERPDVVREVYRMLTESKRLGGAPDGIDTMPFGFEENRRSIELAITFALEQKIIPRRFSADELYADFAAALVA